MKGPKRGRPRRQRQRRPFWLLPAIILAAVAITAGLIWVSNRGSGPATEAVTIPTITARPYADGKALGPANAPVLVEEYSDFQ